MFCVLAGGGPDAAHCAVFWQGGAPERSTACCVPAGAGLTAAHRAVFRPLPFPHLVASVGLPDGQINEMRMFRRLRHPNIVLCTRAGAWDL